MRIQSDSLGVVTDRHVEIHLFGMGAAPRLTASGEVGIGRLSRNWTNKPISSPISHDYGKGSSQ
jgi:hypothetical protein